MAKSQIEPPSPSLETLLAKANAEVTAIGVVDMPDPSDSDAVRAMVWGKLVAIAAAMPATHQALPTLRELMDRLEGKPMQRIKQDTTVSFDLKANGQLLDRLAKKMGATQPITIEGDSTITDIQ